MRYILLLGVLHLLAIDSSRSEDGITVTVKTAGKIAGTLQGDVQTGVVNRLKTILDAPVHLVNPSTRFSVCIVLIDFDTDSIDTSRYSLAYCVYFSDARTRLANDIGPMMYGRMRINDIDWFIQDVSDSVNLLFHQRDRDVLEDPFLFKQ
jgi:hypothetical protein